MNKFFSHLFNQSTSYVVRTKINGLHQILWIICHERTVDYERLHHLENEEERSNGWYVLEITTTPRNVKKLIKTLKQRLNWEDFVYTEIYEGDDTVDLLKKSTRVK